MLAFLLLGAVGATPLPRKPVLVLGAAGQTGLACVRACVGLNVPCIATSRNGAALPAEFMSQDLLTVEAADATNAATLSAAIRPGELGGVIFAASASTKGGDADAVDHLGLIKVAEACIAARVPRLVIVSSGTVTRPDSAVHKLLNFVGRGIMDAKLLGEDRVRELYATPSLAADGIGYTIVRPGALLNAASRGVGAVELNQGDDKSGRIARDDVGRICVECLTSDAACDTTFECYCASPAALLYRPLSRATAPHARSEPTCSVA